MPRVSGQSRPHGQHNNRSKGEKKSEKDNQRTTNSSSYHRHFQDVFYFSIILPIFFLSSLGDPRIIKSLNKEDKSIVLTDAKL